MRLTFSPDVANRLIEHAATFRNSGLAQRVIEVDHEWEGTAQKRLDTPPKQRQRDFWGREIVPCDPNCTETACSSYRARVTEQFGAWSVKNLHCAGCLECVLMDE